MSNQIMQRRLFLGAGWLCLALGFLPTGKITTQPRQSELGIDLDMPMFGKIDQNPTKRVYRVGVPFSPLFEYVAETSYGETAADRTTITPDPNTGTTKTTLPSGGTITVNSQKEGGSAEIVNFNFKVNYSYRYTYNVISLSTGLVILGLVLLIVARMQRKRQKPASAGDSVFPDGSGPGPAIA